MIPGIVAGAGKPFDPFSLWAAGEIGPFYLIQLGRIWQDAAGTSPATTPGQTVRRIDDASGSGLHATGTGILRATANGSLYVENNGTSHSWQFGSMGGGNQRSFGWAGRLRTTGSTAVILEQSPDFNQVAGAFIHIWTAAILLYNQRSTVAPTDTYNTAYASGQPTSFVSTHGIHQFEFDRTQPTIPEQRAAWHNNVAIALEQQNGPFPAPTLVDFPSTGHFLGARNASQLHAPMDLHVFYGLNRLLTSNERQGMASYLASQI